MVQAARHPFRVLVVSTRNTGCSLMAERLLRPALAAQGFERDAIRVTSAGLTSPDGATVPDVVISTLERMGGNAGGFHPRHLDEAIALDADVILTMSRAERDEVMQLVPRMTRRTFALDEYLHLADAADLVVPLAEQPMALAQFRDTNPDVDFEDLASPRPHMPSEVAAAAATVARLVTDLVALWLPIAPADARIVPAYIPANTVVTVRLSALQVGVDIECSGQGGTALARALMTAWHRCVRRAGVGDTTLYVVIDDNLHELAQARSRGHLAYASVAEAMHALSSLITVRAIDARAGELVMIHAAGLALPDGRVFAFAAPSGTGKTTLCRELGTRFGYVTDETLAVTPDGTVIPYPKPLSVVHEGTRVKDQVAPQDAHLMELPDVPLTLAGLVMLHRKPGVEEAELVALPLLEGIVELAPQLSYLNHVDKPLQTLAQVVESVGGIHQLTYASTAMVEAVLTGALQEVSA